RWSTAGPTTGSIKGRIIPLGMTDWAGSSTRGYDSSSDGAESSMNIYRALAALALVAILSGSSMHEGMKPYAVEEVPLAQISADLASGKATSVAVTQAYIHRIKIYDHALHSVILIAPDALDQAAASDKRRAEHRTLSPLDGVPILLKDNIDAV